MWRAVSNAQGLARRWPRIAGVLVALAAASALGAAPASAATHTWTGPSGGLWSNAANWTGGVPTSSESGGTFVSFGTGTTSTDDIGGLIVDQVKFTGGSNTINGSAGQTLGLTGALVSDNILSGTAGNQFGASLTLQMVGTATVFVKSTVGQLTLSGPITGPSNAAMRFFGAGTAGTTIVGTNTLAGKTSVTSGTLSLNNSGFNAALTGSELDIGTGSGTPATVKLLQALEIGGATPVVIANDGTFDSGIYTEDVVSMAVNGGTVTTNTATLNVSGALTVSAGGSVVLTTGTINANGTLGITDATVDLGTSGKATVAGTFTMNGGTVLGNTGAKLVLKGDISATSSATQGASVSAPVNLAGDRTFTIADGPSAVDLLISGVVSDDAGTPGGGGVIKAGPGTMRLGPSSSNLYTRGTTIADGVLETRATAGHAIPPSTAVTIGDDTGAAGSAVLRLTISNDTSATNDTVVKSDGRFDLNGFTTTVGALNLQGSTVDVGSASGQLTVAGTLTMAGGAINGPGKLRLGVAGVGTANVSATSSAAGSATITAPITVLSTAAAFAVPAGTAPELVTSGGITGAPFAPLTTLIAKTGPGTMTWGANNSRTGQTDVQGGTLEMNTSPRSCTGTPPVCEPATTVVVEPGATLTGHGSLGAITVGGTLRPLAPGISTGDLAFASPGTLATAVPASGTAPGVSVTGTVSIAPSAQLSVTASPQLTHATAPDLKLIDDDGADPVTGSFASAGEGAVIGAGPALLPYVVSYLAGDGNDLGAAVRNALPVISVPQPAAAAAGSPVALSVAAVDADGDPLTYAWDFGDGSTGAGAEVTHAYAAAGTYTAAVTVSDGRGSVHGSRTMTVAAAAHAPVLTFTIAKGQRLSKQGALTAKLGCDKDCTVTLVASVKPPGKGAKTRSATTTVKLAAGKTTSAKVLVQKKALAAVRTALRRRQKVKLTVAATARDAAGNASPTITVARSLRP